MDNPPIRRYCDDAFPHLRGKEILSPYFVKPTGDQWTVYKGSYSKDWEPSGTFCTYEQALHHARILNHIDLVDILVEAPANRAAYRDRHKGKPAIVQWWHKLIGD